MLVTTKPEKATKAHDGVHHPSAHFLDDQVVDRAHVLALWAVDGGALNPVTLDEGVYGRSCIGCLSCCSCCLGHDKPPAQNGYRTNPTQIGQVPHRLTMVPVWEG